MPSGNSQPRGLEVGRSPGKGKKRSTSGGRLKQRKTLSTKFVWSATSSGTGFQQAHDSTRFLPWPGRSPWGKIICGQAEKANKQQQIQTWPLNELLRNRGTLQKHIWIKHIKLPAEVLFPSAALLSTSNLWFYHSRKKKKQRVKESGGIASEGHLQRLWHRVTVLHV